MNLGTVQPGGEAEPHLHETEHQVMYVLEGECEVTLGDDGPVTCGPGTVVRIPPKLLHRVVAIGDAPMRAVVLYSPPLGPRKRTPRRPELTRRRHHQGVPPSSTRRGSGTRIRSDKEQEHEQRPSKASASST